MLQHISLLSFHLITYFYIFSYQLTVWLSQLNTNSMRVEMLSVLLPAMSPVCDIELLVPSKYSTFIKGMNR